MAETLPEFVQKRRAGWERLSALVAGLKERRLTLDELEEFDRLYRRTSTDLAVAKTFYAGSDATVYLNQLCATAYATLYARRGSVKGALLKFAFNDLPGVFMAELRFFWLAVGIVVAGAAVGAIAAIAEPASVMAWQPEALREHLKNGTLWTDSVLSASPPLVVGSTIIVNNLTVALSMAGTGLVFGAGTVGMLLFNGLHIGSVVALCFQSAIGVRILGFMAAHGFVELTALLLAGQAGLILGAALIDPGELTRSEALSVRGRRAVTLLFGALPLLLFIGFVEGFVSPGELFSPWMKLALGVSLDALVFTVLVRFGRTAKLDQI